MSRVRFAAAACTTWSGRHQSESSLPPWESRTSGWRRPATGIRYPAPVAVSGLGCSSGRMSSKSPCWRSKTRSSRPCESARQGVLKPTEAAQPVLRPRSQTGLAHPDIDATGTCNASPILNDDGLDPVRTCVGGVLPAHVAVNAFSLLEPTT